MDFLRQQLAVLQERLSGLNASQKMLTAALAVILVMTMLYWGRFASTAERVSLFPNALSGEELTGVTAALRGRGIDYTVVDGKIMVSAERQLEAFGEAASAQALPANVGSNALDAMFEKITPFDSSLNFSTRLNGANQRQIEAVLLTWRGVRKANVILSEGTAGFGRKEPRLSVNIATKGDVEPKKIANAARAFLVNCVASLDPKNISVSVDMQTFTGNDAGGGGDAIEILRQYERAESEKLSRQLQSIPGVIVNVTAEVDASTRSEWRRSVDPKAGKIESVTQSKRETSTPMTVGAPAAEPGVVANTVLSTSPPPSPASVATGNATEKIDESTLVDYNQSNTQISTPANTCKLVGATVGIPRSVIVQMWRLSQPTVDPTAKPTDAQFQETATRELGKIRAAVRALTKIEKEEDITVGEFWDFEPIIGGPVLASASPGAATNLTLLASNNAKEVAVGMLALASLFMVSRMVKKAAPATITPSTIAMGGSADEALAALSTAAPSRPTTINGEDIVGDVGDSSPVMFGQELDSEVLETSQMIEQVAGFVKQNPDAAAKMINQWMSRD